MQKEFLLLERIRELEIKLTKKENENRLFTEKIMANLSHEIRTPLNAIIGFSGLMKSGELSKHKKQKYVEHINHNADRLLFLLENIIELSQLQSNRLYMKIEKCSVTEILKNALYYSTHLKEKYKKFNVALISNDPILEGSDDLLADDYRIVLILKNLLNNALKHTEEGYVEFGCREVENRLEFYVKDTGSGIEKTQESVFGNFNNIDMKDPLKQSDGLGIGLSICKGILNNMGGDIWFAENNMKGTSFYFTIPYRRSKTNVDNVQKTSTFYVG